MSLFHFGQSHPRGSMNRISARENLCIAPSELSPEELRKRWKNLFGVEAPRRLRSPLMVQTIGFRIRRSAVSDQRPADGWIESQTERCDGHRIFTVQLSILCL